MKGFFDAVPWDIEMSAHDRRRLAPPGVPAWWCCRRSRSACSRSRIFAFLRGWEEYVFVRTLLIQKSNWTMSLYLFWMRDDVMGTDYAMVSAMGVFYVLPSILLYTFTQKYLTQMTIGGIKG